MCLTHPKECAVLGTINCWIVLLDVVTDPKRFGRSLTETMLCPPFSLGAAAISKAAIFVFITQIQQHGLQHNKVITCHTSENGGEKWVKRKREEEREGERKKEGTGREEQTRLHERRKLFIQEDGLGMVMIVMDVRALPSKFGRALLCY